MGSILFFLKSMVVTTVVVLLMQIRWGDGTIEDYTMDFLTSSAVVKPIDQTAKGSVIFIRNTWSKITRSLNTNFSNALRSENQPGSRQASLAVRRSEDTNNKAVNPKEEVADTASLVERFKRKTAEVSRKVRSRFIDETDVPESTKGGKTYDSSLATSTQDDDALDDATETR